MEMILNNKPEIMTASIQAVWDEENGYWLVRVIQKDARTYNSGEYKFINTEENFKISACDEFVLASALLKANGINVKELFDGENPIVEE